MRKTPSYLKGLAETRARAAADVLRYQQVINEIGVSLAKAQAEVDACDTLIKKFDDRLDPTLVQPINHWKGRYGKRGALRQTIIALLQKMAPASVTTTEIGWHVQLTFDIGFNHWRERRLWMANSIGNCLKKLVKEGAVEPCHDRDHSGEVGRWKAILQKSVGSGL